MYLQRAFHSFMFFGLFRIVFRRPFLPGSSTRSSLLGAMPSLPSRSNTVFILGTLLLSHGWSTNWHSVTLAPHWFTAEYIHFVLLHFVLLFKSFHRHKAHHWENSVSLASGESLLSLLCWMNMLILLMRMSLKICCLHCKGVIHTWSKISGAWYQ